MFCTVATRFGSTRNDIRKKEDKMAAANLPYPIAMGEQKSNGYS